MAKKPPDIHLFTASTMNGWKPLIFLQEAGVDYDLTHVDFGKREQKSAEYRRLNSNGRIPTILDRGNDDFVVFESNAILWYLAEKFERFLPEGPKGRSQVLQWLMFQVSGVGPMMGQAMFFQRIAAPQGHCDAYAIERCVGESRRLLEVVDAQLAGKSYLLGDVYTIADMAMYP
ncbi:MAG TPA: glutathione S-transferase family protein, partial [Polyangiales bacterium]|nr:glutathione S-transferase family protein [Polyangiales bacterium]